MQFITLLAVGHFTFLPKKEKKTILVLGAQNN